MPVLASFSYPQGATFAVQRQQLPAWAIGWQPDAIALQSGQYTILKEFSFGGYELHIKIKDWIWEWDNRGFILDEIFEDYYAIPPGGGPPVSAGTVFVSWEYEQTFLLPIINITNPAPAAHYYFQRFPAATRPYWTPVRDTLPATPFWFP